MFTSNQQFIISGDKREQLSDIIDFLLKFAEKDITDIVGYSVINGKMIFGWCPRESYQKNEPGYKKYNKQYKKEYQFFIPPIPVTKNIIIEIIYDWLNEQYEKIDKKEYNNIENPEEGFLVIGTEFESGITFPVFKIKPYITEYCD